MTQIIKFDTVIRLNETNIISISKVCIRNARNTILKKYLNTIYLKHIFFISFLRLFIKNTVLEYFTRVNSNVLLSRFNPNLIVSCCIIIIKFVFWNF